MTGERFLEEGAQSERSVARVAILPVPYEGTVSYGGGTSRGPEAILTASEQLELFDERLGFEPHGCGIWTDAPLSIPKNAAGAVSEAVRTRVGRLMDEGKWVVTLGGEHSITPGAVRAAAERHPDLVVVQLDAHADLRDRYEGTPESHACAMARCLEVAGVHALGIRSYSAGEARRIREGIPGYSILHAWEMTGRDWIEGVLEGLAGARVYLTIDVDYFDPSRMPSTGTPEPGGPDWWTTLALLDGLFEVATVVGCDVVELAPVPGVHHPDFTAARLVQTLIGLAFRGSDLAGPPLP